MNIFCEPSDFSDNPQSVKLLSLLWNYYILKYIDLLDTVFFILKKSERQVTFLHVYHHAGVVMLSFVVVKFLGGGHSAYLAFINSLVHTVMYFYYFLSVKDKKYVSVRWKKVITQLQLVKDYAMIFFLCFFSYTMKFFRFNLHF